MIAESYDSAIIVPAGSPQGRQARGVEGTPLTRRLVCLEDSLDADALGDATGRDGSRRVGVLNLIFAVCLVGIKLRMGLPGSEAGPARRIAESYDSAILLSAHPS